MREQITLNDTTVSVHDYMPSYHAQWRMSQRNLSPKDVLFVLQHGKIFHKAGAILVYLRNKDVPASHKNQSRLSGATVVLSRVAPKIITVYRNRQQGLRQIKAKPSYSRSPRYAN